MPLLDVSSTLFLCEIVVLGLTMLFGTWVSAGIGSEPSCCSEVFSSGVLDMMSNVSTVAFHIAKVRLIIYNI